MEEGYIGMTSSIGLDIVVGPISLSISICRGLSIYGATVVDIGGSGCGASINISGS